MASAGSAGVLLPTPLLAGMVAAAGTVAKGSGAAGGRQPLA
jgi:hypothetical protein